MARTTSTVPQADPPDTRSLPELREAAQGCTACDLYKSGTQTVFGEGPRTARVMLVGEQPGDQEDREGRPFVGPAGRVLEDGLLAARFDRKDLYVTNAVKHFKYEREGKRRIHAKPNARELHACRPWLEAEIRALRPGIIVLLGASAARSVLGPSFRVTHMRGEPLPSPYPEVGLLVATVHPSSILRAPEAKARMQAFRAFVADLRKVRALLESRELGELGAQL